MESDVTKSRNPSGNQEGGQAKSGGGALDKLSREELVTKCKNLLAIAQKAKAAKDEVTVEHKKLKTSHHEALAEADALREMVTNLTEGKVAHTTKIESLQRQLKVSTSEVDSQREVEQNILKERQQLIRENSQIADELKKCQEQLDTIKDSSSEKFKLLENTWKKERLTLEGKIENLEAQNGQVDILKTKCKKLLEEKTGLEEELLKQKKLVAKGIKLEGEVKLLKEEKKADAIILESSKSEQKKLLDKIKNLETKVVTFEREKKSSDNNQIDTEKIKQLEDELKEKKSLLDESDRYLKEVQGQLANLQQEHEQSCQTLEKSQEEKQSAVSELKALQDQFNVLTKNKQEIENKLSESVSNMEDLSQKRMTEVDTLNAELVKAKEEIQELLKTNSEKTQVDKQQSDEKIKALETQNSDLEKQNNLLETQLKEKSEISDNLTEELAKKDAEIDDIKSRLTRVDEKIRELETQNSVLEKQNDLLETKLKEKSEIGDNLSEELKKKDAEIKEMTSRLKDAEGDKNDLANKNKDFKETIEQVERLKQELDAIMTEKLDFSKRNENLETEVKLLTDKVAQSEQSSEELTTDIKLLKDKLSESENSNQELAADIKLLRENLEKAEESNQGLATDIKLVRENLEKAEQSNREFSDVISNYESQANSKSREDEQHKEMFDSLCSEKEMLKSLNDDLERQLEELRNDIKTNESVMNDLNSTGKNISDMCKELHPSYQNLFASDIENDIGSVLKSVLELFDHLSSKQSESKYEENFDGIIGSLKKFQTHCKYDEASFTETGLSLHVECFEQLNNSLINFSKSVTFLTDRCKENGSELEVKCTDVNSVYKKFCEDLQQELVKFDHLRRDYDEVTKEKELNEKNLSDERKEKASLMESLEEIRGKLTASEKRCVDFETKLTSGDSEKEEIVKNLQAQVFDLGKEKDKINEDIKALGIEKSRLDALIETQNKDIAKISSEKDLCFQEKKDALAEKEQIESILENLKTQSTTREKCLMDEKQDLEKKLTILSEEKVNLEKEFASLNSNRRSLEEDFDKEKKSISDRLKELLEDKETWNKEKEKLIKENKDLQENVGQLQTRIEEINVEVKRLVDKIQNTEDDNQTLQKEKESTEKELKEAQNQILQSNASLETSGNRCEELLSELNDMNKVLRERGERISRLEATNKEKTDELEDKKTQLQELHHKMSSNEAELASKQEQLQTISEKLQSFSSDDITPSPNSNTQQTTKLEERIKELEQEKCALNKTIQGLESELQNSRENSGPCHDGQSEVMSTSTISRADDFQRMKELEDTFEERYMKLKSVAIKLKKRVAELTAQLNSSEESRTKLTTEKEDLKKRVEGGGKEAVKATTKNIQIMQGEIDRLQDEVDSKKKELKESGKQLNSAAEQLSNVKSQLADSQEENSTLLKTMKNQEENLAVQRDECSSLRGQISALEKRIAAEAEQQVAVEERRKKAEERMEEERQRASHFAKELDEAKQDMKNKSLMDLEMRDYELTVEDLNNKLAEKEASILDLQADMVREKGRSSSLQDQLTHLTAQEATERERADKLKKLLMENKTQLAELRQIHDDQSTAQEKDKAAIEELTQELEKQKLVLADISNEKTRLDDVIRKTRATSERRIETLEEQLMNYKTETTQLKTELDTVKKEFEGYKLRATSVLRQKARAPEVDVNELKGEKDQLQDDYQAAHLRMQQLQSELSALRAEHGFLQSEKEGISRQLMSLTEDLNKRETIHREKITSLESKMDAKAVEYQLIIASMSSQNETLSNSFKKQLETVRQTHTREVEGLTSKLETAEDKLWQLKNTINTSATPTSSSSSNGLAVAQSLRNEGDQTSTHNHSYHHRRQASSHGVDEPKIDVSNMVREEGEGSEWVEPVHRSPSRPGYSPPPLEQLISSPLPSNPVLPPQDDTLSIASIATDATTKEISRLESKVSSGEMRIQQLTSLLHESEAENAKLAQLSDALKEEIRRTSRNESREKHMENMEYMKNVILKFVLMKDGEERKHMVPVLKTVLQLSPQETSNLEKFAMGDESGGSQGWGTYLHLWSSR